MKANKDKYTHTHTYTHITPTLSRVELLESKDKDLKPQKEKKNTYMGIMRK